MTIESAIKAIHAAGLSDIERAGTLSNQRILRIIEVAAPHLHAVIEDYQAAYVLERANRNYQENKLLKFEEDICRALPGVYYMDPPDGGDVSLAQQVERMAVDAARYRWLRDVPEGHPAEEIGNMPGDMWDRMIDEYMREEA